MLGLMVSRGLTAGLIRCDSFYGVGLQPRSIFANYYAASDRTGACGRSLDGQGLADFYASMLPLRAPIIAVSFDLQFHQHLERTFCSDASFAVGRLRPPILRCASTTSSTQSTGVREYNVHFAGAIMRAGPTLLVYIVAGAYCRARPDGWLGRKRSRQSWVLDIDNVTKGLRLVEVLLSQVDILGGGGGISCPRSARSGLRQVQRS